ncbi:MAG: serine/threonine protein kinase [Alphaproteobacteria bacterium]|nr:serine/threonine protein kinase [Alphaproteobacteria bacterium]
MLGVLGRGGFGTVYRADLLGEGSFVRPVALKVLNPDMEGVASVAARLRDEARLLGRIRHRAVVHVDGLVRLDERWTVVMEYVEGIDLAQIVAQGPVPPRAAFEVVGEVAAALAVVHAWPGDDGRPLGILHRDLKPANLLVTAAGEVKVLDFGVARADFDDREARTQGMRFGSPGYLAPERLEGDERPEGDVFSLGVVLYEMLTARRLGKVSVRREKHAAQLDEALPHLPTLPPDATDLVRRMLAWEPEGRPMPRDVERACRELIPALPGEWLREWAEDQVPPRLSERRMEGPGGEFTSDIVTERVSTALDPAPTADSLQTFEMDLEAVKALRSEPPASNDVPTVPSDTVKVAERPPPTDPEPTPQLPVKAPRSAIAPRRRGALGVMADGAMVVGLIGIIMMVALGFLCLMSLVGAIL